MDEAKLILGGMLAVAGVIAFCFGIVFDFSPLWGIAIGLGGGWTMLWAAAAQCKVRLDWSDGGFTLLDIQKGALGSLARQHRLGPRARALVRVTEPSLFRRRYTLCFHHSAHPAPIPTRISSTDRRSIEVMAESANAFLGTPSRLDGWEAEGNERDRLFVPVVVSAVFTLSLGIWLDRDLRAQRTPEALGPPAPRVWPPFPRNPNRLRHRAARRRGAHAPPARPAAPRP